jgi:hypothetical protein
MAYGKAMQPIQGTMEYGVSQQPDGAVQGERGQHARAYPATEALVVLRNR